MTILTAVGKSWIVDKMRGTVVTEQKYIAWGTGATAEAVGNTALATPAAEARTLGTMSSPSAALYRVVGTITSTSTQTITEVGLFDATTAGVMLIRALFTGVPMVSGDSIAFTVELQQT